MERPGRVHSVTGRSEDPDPSWCVRIGEALRVVKPEEAARLHVGFGQRDPAGCSSALYRHEHGAHDIELFYATPTPGNTRAGELFATNIFSVTRQLRYSRDETALALDIALFINGLPVATFELKNSLTKQTVEVQCSHSS